MREDVPSSIKNQAQDLSPDALVSLFLLELSNGVKIYFTPHPTVTWRGNQYDEIACTLSSMEQDTQGRANRPKFSFINPGGIFTTPIQKGLLNNAPLTRYRLHKADLDANNAVSIKEMFRISKIVSLNKSMCVVELRDVFDGHMFKLPARAYYPPKFPHVRLQ